MVHFPDVQRRAQAEIDRVVGKSRLPEFHDRPVLPYLEAMLLETLRWHVITPLAVPHRAIRDDEYRGYHIPAGATVTPNIWAILHDPVLYPDPFEFKPERFLDARQENVTFSQQPDPTIAGTFGYGRR
jgi:cytochrome P450